MVLSATARRSHFISADIRTLQHGGMARVKWQTGLVSGDLGGQISGDREYSTTLNMPVVFSVKIAITLSLPPLHSLVISPAVAMCVCLSCPLCPGHACVHDHWWQQFRVASEARTKTK